MSNFELQKNVLVVKISCPDRKGLVYDISNVFAQNECNIIEIEEFVSEENSFFYMRSEVVGELSAHDLEQLLKQKLSFDRTPEMLVEVSAHREKKVVLFCSKEPHCVADLLIRSQLKNIDMKIEAMISNHQNLAYLANSFSIPYHYIPIINKDKAAFEQNILEKLKSYSVDCIVLAKFMQILSPEFIQHYQQKIINVHHSLLPAFMGANPYQKALERGVKLVGATAHFLTQDLDAGPIITQNTTSINHRFDLQRIKRYGHEVEKQVLAEAVKLFVEQRIFIHHNRTIVFE